MSDSAAALVKAEDAAPVTTPFADILWHCHAQNSTLAKLAFGTATFPEGGGHASHRHPNAEEFIYVVSGKATQTVVDQTFNMGPGDCANIPQDAVHSTMNVGDGELVILVGFSAADPETIDLDPV
ncbi:cupin domain-containing protein [Candidatus Poribacteria bacterium]|jgi:oxalate decarboxylase/phosphoglucose isomerase-like protein (cupin superfamily)|nr:cupin domain-containing protein [Candidatus Poribacteria bacterium]MBT5531492.1 cupin domain-containing protein [Candidatus Poribacteria bacterium]MBT5713544.1 cupin domain-containing protein [Candidatus Poribacteria bacterium]MBT7100645.1 cupin domain-containing protein [Candidatus Poribacteria bacterium]MBT7808590.1 cupin domain-containing protein [Candidatus Poribacteria bacterium]